tara:strand:- start:3293 stop:4300 length:1008 start_codon:yes stop_codon:yes gene_type:complete
MDIGKIPKNILEALLSSIPILESCDTRYGPAIGEDCAILNLNGENLLIGSDPITFPTTNPGWHSVIINSNDIAASGGTPRWYLATILMPPHSNQNEFSQIFEDVVSTCVNMGIQLVGGHSEITNAVRHPIVSGSMIGLATDSQVKPTCNARLNDNIFLTKYCPIEGINIIVSQLPELLKKANLSESNIKNLEIIASNNNMSILPEAALLRELLEVHSMHDPTEGGIANAIHELLSASQLGGLIYETSLPIPDTFANLCSVSNINPLGLIASGSLLFTASPDMTNDILSLLAEHDINCSVIGRTLPAHKGIQLATSDSKVSMPLPYFDSDELTKIT